jgi:hypothetical protein
MAIVDEMNAMPVWMRLRHILPAARIAHNFCAERIRKKLLPETSAEILLAEAFDMVRREMGPFSWDGNEFSEPFPDEDDVTERDMREIALRNYDSLSEIETYMWGLGVAGVFHQWERDTRMVIAALQKHPPKPERLEKMDFEDLCEQVSKTGFIIKQHCAFSALRLAALIANTIKHGGGKAFRELAGERPDLFHGGPVGVRIGNLPPQPHHLRVSTPQFDEAASAIDKIWKDYEEVVLARK